MYHVRHGLRVIQRHIIVSLLLVARGRGQGGDVLFALLLKDISGLPTFRVSGSHHTLGSVLATASLEILGLCAEYDFVDLELPIAADDEEIGVLIVGVVAANLVSGDWIGRSDGPDGVGVPAQALKQVEQHWGNVGRD
jgi:hypothetical protein